VDARPLSGEVVERPARHCQLGAEEECVRLRARRVGSRQLGQVSFGGGEFPCSDLHVHERREDVESFWVVHREELDRAASEIEGGDEIAVGVGDALGAPEPSGG